uniref:EGF-like domain-containing protein n=1 Tax=Globodera rostochiensis TaxID=31243 RepID=A0A914HSR9_GLORO
MASFSVCILLLVSLLLSVKVRVYGVEEEAEIDLSVFGPVYVTDLERNLVDVTGQNARSLLSELGKIALYLRLYRSSITSPITGHKGFDSFFPQPTVRFHRDLYGNCSDPAKFSRCVSAIFCSIQPSAKFLFPLADQQTADFLQLDKQDFDRQISNSRFNFDMSASYLLCFLTKNRLSVLVKLPFCSYGVEKHQKKSWPTGPFRRFKQKTDDTVLDPIDTFLGQREFECADVSFCPDPCCGRKSTRFFRGDDNLNSTDFGFCPHSACVENVKHLDERVAAEHFKRKKKADSKKKKEETMEQNDKTPSTVSRVNSSGKGSRGIKDRKRGDAVVNTHYCYLESPFNDDFDAIMQNRWNLSCACASANGSIDTTKLYRFDVLQCVDKDECLYEKCSKVAGQQCLNMKGGSICVCPVGQYFSDKLKKCVRVPLSSMELKDVLFKP